ncbi:hypothetical protein I4U23_010534 [Adineta vaga]|nr:hypothetical protein I4U23_010534 [Adineta vaga]
MQLLIHVQTILHELQIKYFMTKGTFIGSLRHHDIILRDTDIDLFIPQASVFKLKRSFEQQNKFINVDENDHFINTNESNTPLYRQDLVVYQYRNTRRVTSYKIFSIYSSLIDGTHYRWPKIDMFPYQQNRTHVFEFPRHDHNLGTMKYLSITDLEPFHLRLLGPLLIPSPRHLLSSLRAMIQLAKANVFVACEGNKFLLRQNRPSTESWRVPCRVLTPSYPFVKSDYDPNNKLCTESIIFNNRTNLNFSLTLPIMFTQSYQWRRTQTYCDQTFIGNQTRKIPMNGDKLQCVTNSSLCGNYAPLSVNGYCTDFSTFIDTSSSQISNIETITMDSKFCVAYQGSTWPGIISSKCGFSCYLDNARWSLGCCIDLTTREDGFINTAPVATVISPICVPPNTINTITIPVTDADDDVLRCRWASNISIFDECGDICGIVPGSTLYEENCTLVFDSTGKQPGDYYAVALMVEDFYNDTNSTALSSVSIQFLIRIVAGPSCYFKPIITLNSSINSTLKVGTNYSLVFTISTNCSGVSIVDYFRSPLLNMRKSNLTFDAINNLWIITETWMPNAEQVGSQIYCAVATDRYFVSIQSDLYCIKFTITSTYDDEDEDEDNSNNTGGPPNGYSNQYGVSSTASTSELATTFEITTTTSETTTTTTSETTTTTSETTTTTSETTTTTSETTTTTETTTTSTASTSTSETSSTSTSSTSSSSSTSHQLLQPVRQAHRAHRHRQHQLLQRPLRTLHQQHQQHQLQRLQKLQLTIPVSTKDNSGLLGLGLGLGLPLGLAFIALTAYGLYRGPAAFLGFDSNYKFFNRPASSINQVGSIEKFPDDINDSVNSEYHHEEINEILSNKQTNIQSQNLNSSQPSSIDNQINNPSRIESLSNEQTLSTNEQLLPKGNSFTTISISDFELNNLDKTPSPPPPPSIQPLLPPPSADETVRQAQTLSLDMNQKPQTQTFSLDMNSAPPTKTTTQMLSIDMNSLPSTQTLTMDMNSSQPNGSVLVNAYSDQEKDKFTTVHQLA